MKEHHVAPLHERCSAWESMDQHEVFKASGNKPVPLERLCSRAQARLTEIEADDLDGLWELRAGGRERMWGHRDGPVFYVLWWDPEHTVCPSKKRHT